ncbi:MAG: ABC transporter ATP-binding protein [Phycicoccus sp.]
MTAAVRTVDLVKTYGAGESAVRALDGVSVGFETGRFTAIMGPSGSGKSTLMHLLAGLDAPTSGEAWVGDVAVSRLSEDGLTDLRRNSLGFVFQQFNLMPTLTAAENMVLPQKISGQAVDPAWMQQVVQAVGLEGRLDHRPSELSGGQQQRVACARALLGRPTVVFADEPTGALDSNSGHQVLTFLRRSVTELDQTVVMVTHDAVAASFADRVVFLADGRLVDELTAPTAPVVLDTIKRLEERRHAQA